MEGETLTKVKVVIFKPQKNKNNDFECVHRFEGIRDEIIEKKVTGVDAVQALLLTLQIIGSHLEFYNGKYFENKLYWLVPEDRLEHFGFLIPPNMKVT